MLEGYDDVIETIHKFREKELPFSEYKQLLLGRASLIGDQLDYPKDWEAKLDAWLELIEFFYGETEYYRLGCSLGDFIEDAIKNERRPMILPREDTVVQNHFQKG